MNIYLGKSNIIVNIIEWIFPTRRLTVVLTTLKVNNKFTPSAANIQKVENLKRNHKDAFLGAKKYYDTGILPHTQLQQETT